THASSAAVMSGGFPPPLDVMILIDRTGSMGQSCTAGGTKLDCARNGIKAFLGAMLPSVDRIGLAVYPPATGNSSESQRCSIASSKPYDDASYSYVVTNPNLSGDFRTSDTGPLNPNSQIVQLLNDPNCLKAQGNTAFAAAYNSAGAVLGRN